LPASIPKVREVAWLSLVPQLAVMAVLIATAFRVVGQPYAALVGPASYLLLSQLLRRTLAASHRRGMRELRRGNLERAIAAFQESYAFFGRHVWVDRFRYLTLLSSSAYSFREMALCNIAFLHAQLGRREEAIHWYQRALREFPACSLARTSLAFAGVMQPPSAGERGDG
jgi:tetratricopeptide (TPR) repeat protein